MLTAPEIFLLIHGLEAAFHRRSRTASRATLPRRQLGALGRMREMRATAAADCRLSYSLIPVLLASILSGRSVSDGRMLRQEAYAESHVPKRLASIRGLVRHD